MKDFFSLSSIQVNINVKGFIFSKKEIIIMAKKIAKFDKKIYGWVEINIIDQKLMKQINRQYRGKNSVTDVLAFAWREENIVNSAVLGQIYICWPRIKIQAKDYQVSSAEEFKRMLIHGFLHLVGYDHQNKKDEKAIFVLQDKILSNL